MTAGRGKARSTRSVRDVKSPSLADIAKVKARICSEPTSAYLELYSIRCTDALRVYRVIEAAFAGVALGTGVGLQEAQGLDDYADAATCAAYRAKDEKDDWHRIAPEALNQCYSSLSFFDAPGMRFHLPAYLLADLRGDYHFGMAFGLTRLSDYSVKQFALLSREQRAAVRAFLLHIADDPNYRSEHPHIVRALEEYWTESSSS